MPRYYPIRSWADQPARQRAIDRLLELRRQLREEIGPHKTSDSLLLATWNIRDFDSNKFKHGPRLDESFHYVAEIIAAFDLVAVQEVNRELSALERLMHLLGPDWRYIVTDTTEGTGGNEERIAFVYDGRKVRFRNVAGEIVLPQGQKIVARGNPDEDADELQFARTPFTVASRPAGSSSIYARFTSTMATIRVRNWPGGCGKSARSPGSSPSGKSERSRITSCSATSTSSARNIRPCRRWKTRDSSFRPI
jgi:hypothetical protein